MRGGEKEGVGGRKRWARGIKEGRERRNIVIIRYSTVISHFD